MKSKAILTLGFLAISFIVYFLVTKQVTDTKPDMESVTPDAYYTNSENVSVEIYNTNDDEKILFTGLGYVKLPLTATTAASGAKYTESIHNIVIWNKNNQLDVYREEDLVFSGGAGTSRAYIDEVVSNDVVSVAESLIPNTWRWSRPATDPLVNDSFLLKHHSDGTITVSTDCNEFTGTYEHTNDGNVKYTLYTTTSRDCVTDDEAIFVDAITQANKITLTDSMLLILSMDDRELIRFEVQLIPLL